MPVQVCSYVMLDGAGVHCAVHKIRAHKKVNVHYPYMEKKNFLTWFDFSDRALQ